jgi:hypothetical protein
MRARILVSIVLVCSLMVVLVFGAQYILVASSPTFISPLAKDVFAESTALRPSSTATPSPTPTATPTPTNTPTPLPIATPTPTPVPIVAPADLDSLFIKYAGEYGVDKSQLIKIANCESGMNANAHNGDYAGIFQYSSGSWSNTRAAMGADGNQDLRTNAEESIKTTAFKLSHGGASAWPSCN